MSNLSNQSLGRTVETMSLQMLTILNGSKPFKGQHLNQPSQDSPLRITSRITSRSVGSRPVPSDHVPFRRITSSSVGSRPVPSDPVPFLLDHVPFRRITSRTVGSCPVPSDHVPFLLDHVPFRRITSRSCWITSTFARLRITSRRAILVRRLPASPSPPAHRAAAQARTPKGSRGPAGRVAEAITRGSVPIMGQWK
jgi:hypothetical protein